MNVIALILLIIAAVLFVFGGYNRRGIYGSNLGLAFLTVGLIVQFASTSHSITF